MQVIASGQAGIFAIQTPTGFAIEHITSGKHFETGARELAYHFEGCNDVKTFTAKSVEDARSRADHAWSTDRAVRLFIIVLDPKERPEDLAEVGEVLDELLNINGVTEQVERQIFSAPLPAPIELEAVKSALNASPLSRDLLERYLGLQPVISRVRRAFDALDDDLFSSIDDRGRFTECAIDSGSFRALVLAAASKGGIDQALFQLYTDLRGFENYRDIVQEWTATFERQHLSVTLEPDDEDGEVLDLASPTVSGAAGRQAYERAMQQQVVIAERIRSADFDVARRFASELVAEQSKTSSPEHIAKTLSSLSQIAKRLDVADLALEWAREAVEVMPGDALAHAQLADMLMRVGRYTEAHSSLDLAQSYGAHGFAASGRARILRYQGQYEDARRAYELALEEPGQDSERKHYNLAGIAECLRDMESFTDALGVYEAAVHEYPYVAALHSGRAATLVDLGFYQEALKGYKTAQSLDKNDLVPRNGIASLYNRAGYFERAEADFRDIIEEYPFDIYSRGGLVKALREMGRFDEAIEEATKLVKHRPTSPDARWILADAQIEAGDLDGARTTLMAAVAEHPYVAGLRTGFARIEKAAGRYSEALALFDRAAKDFPSNGWVQLGRADMLRRLGDVQEAELIYKRSLSRHPHRLKLKNALASIYIHLGRFGDAEPLLAISNPRTSDEWRNFAIRGMFEVAVDDGELAERRFRWGIDACPFRRERQIMEAALARLQLQVGKPDLALETTSEDMSIIAQLIKFHASAAANDNACKEIYGSLLTGNLPEPYYDIRDEIAKRFRVIHSPPERSLEWLLAREADALLLEAA